MGSDTARRHYSNLHRAFHGAELCRQRLAADTASSVHDLVGHAAHDYYAWEATRIVNTGRLPAPRHRTLELAAVPTRLAPLAPTV